MTTVFFRLLRTPIDGKGDALAALGYGVLDTAMVETVAYVLEKKEESSWLLTGGLHSLLVPKPA